ncbi:hypothetical protein D9613_003138 [Agrocybe pediades]|uniref:F-box domain-containing protein n=1 Tax=Agrocybe pediades TaxID=84607 RepID=A0A8H4VP09_9AGAR|nr:hypothetical protein D9613_003138 [Agrocybe pediades]
MHSEHTATTDEQNLTSIHSKISEIETGLCALKVQRRALVKESEKLVANITAKRVQHAPMRELIPELCDIIFAYCAPDECAFECNETPNCDYDRRYPLLLANVCRRWRTMVMGNPSLWTTLHLRPTTHADSEIRRMSLFLRHSEILPLKATICPSYIPRTGWDAKVISIAVLPLLRSLLPELGRIVSLKTHLQMEILPVLFPAESRVHMPLIEHLHLLIDDQYINTASLGIISAPRLRHLHVRDATPLVGVLADVLPHLHSLVIAGCEHWKCARAFPRLLSMCTDLRSCTITFPSNLFFSDVEPIVLPELVYLSLEWPFLFEPSPIFRALRAPKLRSLRIAHRSRQLVLPPQILLSLKDLVQSAQLLSELVISGCNVLTQDEAASLLQEAKSLRKLEIIGCQRGDRFLVPLTPSHTSLASTWVCPMLEHVKIAGLQDSDVRPVISFMRSRTLGMPHTYNICVNSPDRSQYRFLSEVDLDIHSPTLSRQGRLLMLSGLFGMQYFLTIIGPYGNLFGMG